jgi:hypothetical protein
VLFAWSREAFGVHQTILSGLIPLVNVFGTGGGDVVVVVRIAKAVEMVVEGWGSNVGIKSSWSVVVPSESGPKSVEAVSLVGEKGPSTIVLVVGHSIRLELLVKVGCMATSATAAARFESAATSIGASVG